MLIRRADRPGDLGWVVQAHGEVYAEQFGWNTDFEALVARIVADFAGAHDPRREAGWIAEVDGQRAGCVFLVEDPRSGTAKLRILLVTPAARGLGAGRRLVEECLTFAREAGYARVVLWTTDQQATARKLYASAGFSRERARPGSGFGHSFMSEDWARAL